MPKRITPKVEFTKEWINSIPKIINSNGCWIPRDIPPSSHGYSRVHINRVEFKLHRIVLRVYYNIDYTNYKIVSRHDEGCSRACFNPEHIKPGSDADNIRDSVIQRTHKESRKEVCPKCGCEYLRKKRRRNGKTHWERYCPNAKFH